MKYIHFYFFTSAIQIIEWIKRYLLFCIKSDWLTLRYKHGGSSLVGTTNVESILRNELGPAREEKRRKAGKKDKGRDLTRVPTLYWQAWLRVAGCKRVSRGRWLVLSSGIDWERARNLVNTGSMGLKCRRRRKRMLSPPLFQKGVYGTFIQPW